MGITAGEFYKWLRVFHIQPNSSPFNVKGNWDAATNTPTLTSGVGTAGDLYIVSVAGNTNLDGNSTWLVGDWAIFGDGVWSRIPNSDAGSLQKINNLSDLVDVPTALGNIGQGSAQTILTGQSSDLILTNPSPTFISVGFDSPGKKVVLAPSNELTSVRAQGIGEVFIYNNSASISFDVYAADGTTLVQNIPANGAYLFRIANNSTVNGGVTAYPLILSVNGKTGIATLTSSDVGAIGGTASNTRISFGNSTPNTITSDSKLTWDTGLQTLNIDGNINLTTGEFSGKTVVFNNIYVSNQGSNITGNGSLTAPYLTLDNALAQVSILSPDESNQFNIILESGIYSVIDDVLILPYVNIIGKNATLNITGSIILDPSWSSAIGDITFGIDIRELNVTSGISLNFSSFMTPQSVKLFFNNFVYSTLNSIIITGYAASNSIIVCIDNVYSSSFSPALVVIIDSVGFISIQNSRVNGIAITNNNSGQESIAFIDGVQTNISTGGIQIANTGDDFFVMITSSSILNGVTASGAMISLHMDPSSLSVIPVLSGGATLTLLGISSSITADMVATNYTPTNPTVTGNLIGIDNALGSISGSITVPNTEVAFGSVSNTITSSSNLTYISGSQQLNVGGKIGLGTTTVDSSSKMDIVSTTLGTRPAPSMTNAQINAIASPAEGLMAYDATNHQWMGYNGTAWVILG